MDRERFSSAGSSLFGFGFLLLFIGIIGALILGNVVGATVTNGGAVQLLETPSAGLSKRFNWLLFLVAFGPAFCTSMLLFGLGSALRAMGREETEPSVSTSSKAETADPGNPSNPFA